MRETVLRWNWRGHSFLLSFVEEKQVAITLLPSAVADLDGKPVERTRDSEMRKLLKSRVKVAENGDVVVTDIPMVNQGPKGYCVPATYERYLRYMDIPVDMYVLALAGQTEPGGGTRVDEITTAVRSLVRRHGRQMKDASPTMRINKIDRQTRAIDHLPAGGGDCPETLPFACE
jgi:hypothetical protein